MTVIKLINFIEENSRSLKEIGIDITRIPINEGDRYKNKLGISFAIKLFSNEYSIGFYQETMDKENWKSATVKLKSWCKKETERFSPKKLYFLVNNYQIILRNTKIKQLLK